MTKSLVLFTRWPEPGTAKTRLIPALGPDGAADLHRRMTRHIAGRAQTFCRANETRFTIEYEGGDEARMREWLGPFRLREQAGGNLGDRMKSAILRERAEDAERVVVIGSDVPSLDGWHLRAAFEKLETRDLVLGPVSDGGYYLIGLSVPEYGVFTGIPWGTERVLEKTQRRARALGLSWDLLDQLRDVDLPSDVAHAEEQLAKLTLP